ncbi:hypothetical protein WM11_11725 [Burkholderia ubonensis]|uniref:hypothetical protein n=1 Tax=Burkholderia ubonensis TaxID=101571 RepID=UPI0007592E67|nr:hypothetical protein [Burkholderia ubonensis]KWK06055.1 hypothetical protein WM11_11725 [Burkholderia ubonensis]KWK56549.1 hypothetical protein WM14_27220 [Burkholderia ubonensis]
MSLTPFLIRVLARVDEDTVRRAMSTAAAQDDPLALPPAEFQKGANAMAYSLAMFISRRPVQFYVGLSGLIVLPIYLIGTLLGELYGG